MNRLDALIKICGMIIKASIKGVQRYDDGNHR